jgi:hypothetical protein
LTGSIPAGLFAGISGPPAEGMFHSTFYNCTGLTGSIPSGLFAGISGSPATQMFYSTFYGCSGLNGYISPDPNNPSVTIDLFGNISDGTANNMFYGTFYGCSNLQGPSAKSNGQYLYNKFSTTNGNYIGRCYTGATGLSDYASIPAAWK